MKLSSAKLRMIAKLPDDAWREAVLMLADEQEREEKRLAGQRNRTLKWRAKQPDVTSPERHRDRHRDVTNQCIVTSSTSTLERIEKDKLLQTSPPRDRGTRLPDNWEPSFEDKLFALTAGLSEEQVSREIDRFRDYWWSTPGAKGRKTRWPATWRNWVRSAVERSNKISAKPITPYQQQLAKRNDILDRLKAFANSPDEDQPQVCGQLGSPDRPVVSPHANGHGTVHGYPDKPLL